MGIDLLLSSLIIAVLVLISGFFSGSETALTAASRAKLHKLGMEGNSKAKMASRLREDKEGLIGTVLLGNNAVNILASALATSLAIRYLGENGVATATVIMTVVVLVFAEVLPKTYAFYHAEKVSLLVAPLCTLLVKVFGPITKAVQLTVNAVMHVFGMDKEGGDVVSAADALRGAIALHQREGGMLRSYRYMLDSVLNLTDTEVKDVMTHRKNMFTLSVDLPTEELVHSILENHHTRVPLWKETPDNIVGVMHVRDILKLSANATAAVKRSRLMEVMKEPWFIPETTPLGKQLTQFRNRRSHLALIVDEYGDLVGLITLEDILEEIVGEIEDEHDEEVSGIAKLKDGAYRIDGELAVRDINRRLDWGLPDSEAATIAGLVIHELEAIPKVGDIFMMYGYEIKVLKRRKNQITSFKIRKLVKKSPAGDKKA